MKKLKLGADVASQQLVLEGGRIVALGPSDDDGSVDETLDCGRALIAPGRVNAHTHIYSGLAPLEMPPPDPKPQSFVQILERVWWRLDRALDQRSLRASARLYCAEALLAGTTTLVDHHESPNLIDGSLDILAEAASELGIRALLCYGATERNGGRDEGRAGLAECRRFFLRRDPPPRVRGAVGLHASFTVSDETIREAGELCRELGAVLHVHVAEDGADVVDAKQRGYAGPLERLIELEALVEGSIVVHGVFFSADQVRRCADLGAWLVHNPRSNRGNEGGYAGALQSSPKVALGTDGWPARMTEEQAALEELAAEHGDAGWAGRLDAGRDLIGERFGGPFSLTEGGTADVGVYEQDGETRHLVVGGQLVVRDGELLTGDIEAIRAEARDVAPELWQRMASIED